MTNAEVRLQELHALVRAQRLDALKNGLASAASCALVIGACVWFGQFWLLWFLSGVAVGHTFGLFF